LRALLAHVDVIRLDHFRAFRGCMAHSSRRINGPVWRMGARSRRGILQHGRERVGRPSIHCRGLGLITPDVRALRDQFNLPGVRVLQFAFDGDFRQSVSAHNYVTNHGGVYRHARQSTTRAWFEELPDSAAAKPVELPEEVWDQSGNSALELMELAWKSAAAMAMAPLQDLLSLGREARMKRSRSR